MLRSVTRITDKIKTPFKSLLVVKWSYVIPLRPAIEFSESGTTAKYNIIIILSSALVSIQGILVVTKATLLTMEEERQRIQLSLKTFTSSSKMLIDIHLLLQKASIGSALNVFGIFFDASPIRENEIDIGNALTSVKDIHVSSFGSSI